MKKIARQPTCSVRKPPSTGPIASASAETPAQVPIALPRSWAGKASVTIESVAGIISAAPTPWTTRLATSISEFDGEPGGGRGEGEDDDADQEHRAAPEDVAEPAAGREQDGEGERVAVDRPLEAGEVGVEVALDRGQRDVDDGVVEHDHEQREAHRPERPPLAVVVGDQVAVAGHRRGLLRVGAVERRRSRRARAAARARRRACGARRRRARRRSARGRAGARRGRVSAMRAARRGEREPADAAVVGVLDPGGELALRRGRRRRGWPRRQRDAEALGELA